MKLIPTKITDIIHNNNHVHDFFFNDFFGWESCKDAYMGLIHDGQDRASYALDILRTKIPSILNPYPAVAVSRSTRSTCSNSEKKNYVINCNTTFKAERNLNAFMKNNIIAMENIETKETVYYLDRRKIK